MSTNKIDYKKVINRKIRNLSRKKQKAVLNYIDQLSQNRQIKNTTEFEQVLSKSRQWFKTWLQENGYSPNELTDDQVEQIIARV